MEQLFAFLLQLLCYSAILTDQYQTYQWVHGDWIAGEAAMLKEANGGIRTTYELEEMIGFNLGAAEAAPHLLQSPWSSFGLGALALVQVSNVMGNNENARAVGLDERWMIGYRISF